MPGFLCEVGTEFDSRSCDLAGCVRARGWRVGGQAVAYALSQREKRERTKSFRGVQTTRGLSAVTEHISIMRVTLRAHLFLPSFSFMHSSVCFSPCRFAIMRIGSSGSYVCVPLLPICFHIQCNRTRRALCVKVTQVQDWGEKHTKKKRSTCNLKLCQIFLNEPFLP